MRIFARVDRFDRFVSALIYVPRDRYNTRIRERIGALLAETYKGRLSAFYPYFPEGPLVRVQFIIGRYDGPTPPVDVAELERKIVEIVRTWEDRLADAIASQGGQARNPAGQVRRLPSPPATRRPSRPSGRSRTSSASSAWGRTTPSSSISIACPVCRANRIHATVYSLGAPIRLSERVPVLENLGFSAIDERSYHIRPRFADGERDVALHDMVLETSDGGAHRARAPRQAAGGLLPRRAPRAMPTTTASIG